MATWGNGISLKGPIGPAGVGFTSTNGKPTGQGATGEVRIDPNDFTLWSWNGSDWTQSQTFKGVQGISGPVDFFGYGQAAPDSTTYAGDGQGMYIQNPNSEVWLYSKANGWQDAGFTLKGAKGDVGPQGVRGSFRFVDTNVGMPGPPPSDTSSLTPSPLAGDEWIDTTSPGAPIVSFFS